MAPVAKRNSTSISAGFCAKTCRVTPSAVGTIGARHQHPHVQASYVQSGRFRFTRGDEVVDLAAGDSLMIAAHQPHGCLCLEAGVLIDSFAPMREDFL